jgi:two-component system, OmpR family, sensor histidine kinase BaeS
MRTKLFLSFIIIILVGLLSTVLFELLIVDDFGNYVAGVRDDQIHWIRTSIEDAYNNGMWNSQALSESIHWAMMMGLDVRILDMQGKEVIPSHHYIEKLSPNMKQRMEELFHIHTDTKLGYMEFPIHSKNSKIGSLMVRSFQKKELAEKEAVFKTRTRYFLYFYLLFAGLGSALVGLFLVQFLSRPVRLLKKSSEKIADGDFSARVELVSSDEIGELAKAFNKMAESLEKEELLRKRLMSNIAHELRTPLTIMKTHVEAISDGVITDRDKGLENIGNEIERLIELVKGIEDVTVAEASFFSKGETEEIDIREFISGITAEMLPLFERRGLKLEIRSAGELTIRVDAEKLERVIRNLLSNALKFTDKGGVCIDYGREDNSFFIKVSDTGRGISPDDLPFVFNRFYRGDDSSTDGLGLGLAIVRELVNVMGCRVEVESRLNEGSTFKVLIPTAS